MKKILSAAVASLFLVNQIAFADLTVTSPLDPGLIEKQKLLLQSPESLLIPSAAAQIAESHKGPSEKLIIHIQDAHTNLGAQKNLAKVLDQLIGEYGVDLVMVEGGSGDDSLSFLRSFAPKPVREKVALRFLERGEISGEEYLDIISDTPFQLWGVEDPALYQKSLYAYASAVEVRKRALKYLSTLEAGIARIKPRVYNRDFFEMERKAFGFREGKSGFVEYFERLVAEARSRQVPLDTYASIPVMEEVRRLEQSLDFNKVNREQSELLTQMGAENPQFVKMIEEASLLKLGRVPTRAFYERLRSVVEKPLAESGKHPQYAAYLQYLDQFTSLKMSALLEDIEHLEKSVFGTLADTEDAQKLWDITKKTLTLKNYYSLKLKPSEFKDYRQKADGFNVLDWTAFINAQMARFGLYDEVIGYDPVLDKEQGKIEAFYDSVEKRDFAFIEKSFDKMKDRKVQVAVLICGGYHTPHLKELMKKEGASYVVVTPHVTEETDQANYERVLLSGLDPKKRWMVAAKQGTIRSLAARESFAWEDAALQLLKAIHRSDLSLDEAYANLITVFESAPDNLGRTVTQDANRVTADLSYWKAVYTSDGKGGTALAVSLKPENELPVQPDVFEGVVDTTPQISPVSWSNIAQTGVRPFDLNAVPGARQTVERIIAAQKNRTGDVPILINNRLAVIALSQGIFPEREEVRVPVALISEAEGTAPEVAYVVTTLKGLELTLQGARLQATQSQIAKAGPLTEQRDLLASRDELDSIEISRASKALFEGWIDVDRRLLEGGAAYTSEPSLVKLGTQWLPDDLTDAEATALADAMIQIARANAMRSYGRSVLYAVPVRDARMVEYLTSRAPNYFVAEDKIPEEYRNVSRVDINVTNPAFAPEVGQPVKYVHVSKHGRDDVPAIAGLMAYAAALSKIESVDITDDLVRRVSSAYAVLARIQVEIGAWRDVTTGSASYENILRFAVQPIQKIAIGSLLSIYRMAARMVATSV